MVKHIKLLLVFACLIFANCLSVDAAISTCPADVKRDLAIAANHVKIDYEIKDYSEEKEVDVEGAKTTYKIPKYTFEFSIYNITEDLYVTIEKNQKSNDTSFSVYAADAEDGKYTFTDDNTGDIYNYTFTIKSNHPECTSTLLRTLKQTKPRYNAYSEFAYCQNSSSFYCQRFVGSEPNIKGTNDFLSKIKVNNENNNPKRDEIEEKKTIMTILKENWKTYALIFLGVVVVTVVIIFVIKERNKKKGWRL